MLTAKRHPQKPNTLQIIFNTSIYLKTMGRRAWRLDGEHINHADVPYEVREKARQWSLEHLGEIMGMSGQMVGLSPLAGCCHEG